MTTTKAYFGFPRVTESFTVAGGNWLATYPLSNLLVLPLSNIARSLDATTGSTAILATASSPQICSGVALIGHNCSQGATVRLRCWSDVAGTVLVYDSGTVNLWPAGYTPQELDGAMWNWVKRFADPGTLTVGQLQIDITDTGNVDGYVQAGFLEIFQAFDVTYNFGFGAQWGFEWRSQVAEAVGGAEYVDPRDHPRLFKGSFELTTHSDALSKFYEMWRQLKFDKPVLFVPMPADVTYFNKLNMFARQVDPGLAAYRSQSNNGLIHSVPIGLKEIIG